MIKKPLLAVLVLSLALLFPYAVSAASADISVVVNGNKIVFNDAHPFVDSNGRTQTPAKYIGESLGATVEWDGVNKKAVFSFGKTKIVFYEGKKSYKVGSDVKQMDTAAVVKNGRIFVPAKYIAEALGAKVSWDAGTNTVYVNRNFETQVEDGKDVVKGTVVNNETELIEAVKKASHTLQANIVLKCSYGMPGDKLENLLEKIQDIEGTKKVGISMSSVGNVTDLNINITYTDGFRIQQSQKSKIALGRLTDRDIEVNGKVKDILSEIIRDSMTDYQKELAIHDYLVSNCEYDNGTLTDESYTVYGLLMKGKGVCEAYAETAKLMLNSAGIECRLVEGESKGEKHAWNLVKLDNEYYMLDVTWDDPVTDYEGYIGYDYFNLTSGQLSEDHTWNTEKWPEANGTKYNYFIYNNLIVDNYNDFKELVISLIREGRKDILVYIRGYEKSQYNLDFIFSHYTGSSVRYITDGETNTSFHITLK